MILRTPPPVPRRRSARLAAAFLLAVLALGDDVLWASRTAAQAPSADDYVLVDAAGGAALTIAALGDDAVVAGIGAIVAVLDIADRTAPHVIGRTSLLPATPLDIAAAGGSAFAALGAGGLAVIDISDRAAPRLAGRLCLPRPPFGVALALGPPHQPASAAACADIGGPPVVAAAASTDGTTALAVAGGGLLVVDTADPYRPRESGWLPLGIDVRAVAALPGAALVLGSLRTGPDAGNRLVVVDVRAPEAPIVRSWLKLGGFGGAFVDVAAAGTLAVAGGVAGAAVVDLTLLDRPRVAARIDRFVTAVDVRASGGRTLAVLASNVLDDPRPRAIFDDITLYDVTSPATPRRVAGHATVTRVRPTGIVIGGVVADEPWFVLASALSGCTVLERRGTTAIVGVGEALTGGAIRVASAGGHAFVIEGDPSGVLGLQRLVVVDVATGVQIGAITGLTTATAMTTARDRLYVVESNHGVRIVSTAVVTAPQTIGYITDHPTELPPAAAPGWVAIASFGGSIDALDARDPAQIRTVGSVVVSAPVITDMAALGDRLLVAGADRLFAFDLSDPAQPRPIGQTLYDDSGVEFGAARLAVGADRAWLVDPLAGLVAFDARPALPRRIARIADASGLDVVDVGGRAVVRASAFVKDEGHVPTGGMIVVDAPLDGGGAVVGSWMAPEVVLDVAPDPIAAGGLLVASGAYGLTRWQRRADAAPTATPTDAPTRPAATRAALTAVPPDPARPFRAFLPLVTNALVGPTHGAAISLTAVLGGVTGAAAADGDFGYVTSGDRVVAYRLRGVNRPNAGGPEALGSVAVGERILTLAVTHGQLAALVGSPKALEPLAFDFGDFGDGGGRGGGGAERATTPIPPGDGTGLRLIDFTDPSRPRLAARVALPPGAIDAAAGNGDTSGWFAVVGSTDAGGYLEMIDAHDTALPQTARLALGDDSPVGVAITGRRAVVQLDRGATSAARIVHLDRPGAPVNGGTVGSLEAATAAGGVAAARDRGFVLTDSGLAIVDISGREPRLASVAAVEFNDLALSSVVALGANVWVGTRGGVTFQMFVIGDDANTFNIVQLPYMDALGLHRTIAVGNRVLLQAGGLLGSVAAREVDVLDPDLGKEETGGGVAFDDVTPGLGHSAAVAAGPPGSHLAFATNANGSVNPLHLDASRGGPVLGSAFSFLENSLPLPPTGLAIRGPLGVLVGHLTPLRSLQVLGALVAPVAEPLEPGTSTAIDGLRTAPTARRVVLADGFAWVAERNAGLSIFDISEPETLPQAGRVETPGQPRGLAVRAGQVFVADGTAGLTVLDARNPGSPREVGHLAAPGVVGSVALAADGRTAYVTVDSVDAAWLGSGRDRSVVWAVDVRNPARPRVIGAAGLAMDRIADAVLDGNRLYVAGQRLIGGPMAEPPGGTLAVAVVDVADGTRPVVAGQWTAAAGYPYVPSTLCVVGTQVVVALGEGGVAVLDVR